MTTADAFTDLHATDALALRGYTHRPIPGSLRGRHEIVRAGRVVARLRAVEVWRWMRRRDHLLEIRRRQR